METENNFLLKEHLVPEKLSVSSLDVTDSFNLLNEREKKYTHYMSRASWEGAPIIPKQISPESSDIIEFFISIFRKYSPQYVREKLKLKFSESDINDFINYVAMLFGHLGNYNNFGDKKFRPRISKEMFRDIIYQINSLSANNSFINKYDELEQSIFDINNKNSILGFYPDAISAYYSPNISKDEIKIIDEYMTQKLKLEPWNTSIIKFNSPDNNPLYCIYVASAKKSVTDNELYRNLNICVSYGNYSKELKNLVKELKGALDYCLNDNGKKMIECYIKHFDNGNIQDHKESQICWINDKGPIVETNIGFIENYRDPAGVRSEFESFVSIVDKKTSEKFQKLVDLAPELIKNLPWPKAFEKDKFLKPDFTSLEVMTFVASGIPVGINIPNYNDIRQNIGFKNVSLGNIINSAYTSTDTGEITDHLIEKDDIIYKKYVTKSIEIDVGGHELLGHGSGKLFYEYNNNHFNFDKNTIDPLTNEPIKSWYKEVDGDTYSNKFGALGSAYEECRAECVGLLFSTNEDMLNIFGFSNDEDKKNIMFISWLWMLRAGLCSLSAFDPTQKKWLQAHCNARYVIYRVLNEIDDFIKINLKDNFTIEINKDIIITHGLPKLKNFLLKLQIYKSTGNVDEAQKLFGKYSEVDDYHLNLRTLVINKVKPRKIYAQPKTFLDKNGDVKLKVFPGTVDGLIQSICENYPKD